MKTLESCDAKTMTSEAHEERDNEYVPKLVWVPGGMGRGWATTGRRDETRPTILWRSQVSEKDVTSASKKLPSGNLTYSY